MLYLWSSSEASLVDFGFTVYSPVIRHTIIHSMLITGKDCDWCSGWGNKHTWCPPGKQHFLYVFLPVHITDQVLCGAGLTPTGGLTAERWIKRVSVAGLIYCRLNGFCVSCGRALDHFTIPASKEGIRAWWMADGGCLGIWIVHSVEW